jgi:hypothetical protein
MFDVLWLQKEGAWMSIPDKGQSLTTTENVGGGFILHSTLPAQWTVIILIIFVRT